MPLKLPPDLAGLTGVRLMELTIQFQTEIDRITDQLARARAVREAGSFEETAETATPPRPFDRDWYRKAMGARKHYVRDIQRIQLEQGRRKKEGTDTFERRFIEAARRRLTDDAFQGILEEASDTGQYRAGHCASAAAGQRQP